MKTPVVLVAVVVCCVIGAQGHGFLATPTSRNFARDPYCPHCYNGPRFCGDPSGSTANERPGKSVATYRPNGRLTAVVTVRVNHLGRWGLSLCTKPTSRCVALSKTDGSGRYVYIRASDTKSRGVFRVPRVKCGRCTLRWTWTTGNSCTPRGTPKAFANPNLQVCGTGWAPPPEMFTNCADIAVV